MDRRKFVIIFAFVFLLVFPLTACNNNANYESNEKYEVKEMTRDINLHKIGITQFAENPAQEEALKGFKRALSDNGFDSKNVKYDIQIAKDDISNSQSIAKKFTDEKVDLIFAISTQSAKDAVSITKEIPIVFANVADPVGEKLVKSFKMPGGNVTGTSDYYAKIASNTINFIIDEIKAKNIGIIYSKTEQNSVNKVKRVKTLVESKKSKLIEVVVSKPAEVKQAAESIAGHVDAIYVPNDNTVVSSLEVIINVANQKDIPLFVEELDSMKKGAMATSSFSYEEIGYESGLMAVDILKNNKKPSEIKVKYPKTLKLIINKKAAIEQGVKIDNEWENLGEFYSD